MKRIALISLAIAATLHADTLTQTKIEALTPIDALPSTTALNQVLFPDAVAALIDIARSPDAAVDLGVQLRAIRSLPAYCTQCTVDNSAYLTLVALLEGPQPTTPHDLLRLRAAIEAYGEVAAFDNQNNYKYLLPFLSNSSRDIRAATATALGKLCNTLAVGPLTSRGDAENAPGGSQQVVLAISAALRDLANCQVSN